MAVKKKTAAKGKSAATARPKPKAKVAPKVAPRAKAGAVTSARAPGFGPETFAFLAELDQNNERPWFEANRERYERVVRQPALAFIAAMAPALAKFAPHFVADPRPVGGSLMRIHRDTRFSADKRPYKSNIGMHFRHSVGKDIHAPGLYVHIEPGKSFLGVGLWRPEPEPLARVRARLVAKADQWRAATGGAAFRKRWRLEGDSLVRVPKGFDPLHPLADDLRRKDHIAACAVEPAVFAGPVKDVAERFAAAKPYLEFLCSALDLSL